MKSKKNVFILIFVFISISIFSQINQLKIDSINPEKGRKLKFNIDIVSRYIWRGQSWGGNYVAVQPSIEYEVTPKLVFGFWATINFKKDYFYPDGVTFYKGYQETDFYITYEVSDFLSFQIWDYYWPSVNRIEGVDTSFFNYGKDGVKTVDAMLCFDFSEGYKYPFNATISALVAGNDYRYDSNGENAKQNFTTYLELGYTFILFEKSSMKALKGIELYPVIGAVLNNKAGYYSYADYDKVSFINMGIKATKEIDLGKGIKMPLSLNYVYNGANQNTETFGKNFLVAGISFSY